MSDMWINEERERECINVWSLINVRTNGHYDPTKDTCMYVVQIPPELPAGTQYRVWVGPTEHVIVAGRGYDTVTLEIPAAEVHNV